MRLAFLIEGIYGPIPAWHHRDCFFKTHPDMVKQLEDLAGWKNIEEEDREDLKQRIASAHDGPHAGESSSSKSKTTSADVKPVKDLDHDKKIAEESVPVVDKATSERQRQQSQRQWEIKDWLTDELDQFTLKEGKAALHQILDANGYHLGERSEHTLKDVLVDALTFGVPELCASCKQSRLVWDTPGGKYVCPVAEAWGQCTQTAQADEVEHTPAAIPKDFPLRGIAKFGKKPLLKRVTTKRVPRGKGRC